MELSLFYIVCILLTLLFVVDPTDFDISCPTSRRLLLFKELNARLGEKKSHRISSSSKSSPPKYARSGDTHGLTVFMRPKISNELSHKLRSFTHLLTSKLYTNEERALLKRSQLDKKKRLKKKPSASQKSSTTAQAQELIPINDNEMSRCRALLLTDSTTNEEKKTKKEKKDDSIKQTISSKVKTATTQAAKNLKKKVAAAAKSTIPINEQKAKITKRNTETSINEKKTIGNRAQKNLSPATPPSSTSNTKVKREKSPPIAIIKDAADLFRANDDHTDEENNSVVDRAYHFVKNMFQLSDDLLNGNHTHEEDRIISIGNEPQQQYHHSRKLLSVEDYDFDSEEPFDQSLFVVASVPKRRVLSTKTNKHSASSKTSNTKEKKSKSSIKADANKPKVGWAYRYRISRYLDAQNMKRTGNKNKLAGGGKTKHLQKQSDSKQKQKESSSSKNSNISKRKLLQYHAEDDTRDDHEIFNQDLVNTVSITEIFVPKRQLLASKVKDNHDVDDDLEESDARRRMKSFEELTDPIAIIDSYDRGLFKPRVGWQFRYRVSRYIDSLRANIREDQERLKLGLQAIKRKTPQELSGRRKRVLDKPFAPDPDELKKQEEASTAAQENKPTVGWRYRYRIGKMKEAQERGDYIDDEEEKRLVRLGQKTKQSSHSKSRVKDGDIEDQSNLDPELRKINDEGRRVGWAYRYRIRRKLDHLNRQQAENGIPFDLSSLSGKREKKALDLKVKTTEKKTGEPVESKLDKEKKSVGWQYRYRISKMREAQKQEKSKVASSKKQEPIVVDKQLDPELARLKPEERVVGWEYRYRIRRKLDSLKSAAQHENDSGKRSKKSSKGKGKDKMIKQVEESIEKILNIADIDETPFMEYFRRSSSYVLFGLLPTVKKSVCLLPLPVTFSFCNEQNIDQATGEKAQQISKKKLSTKKEHRAKQFIHSRPTKLGAEDKATERRVDEAMRKLYKTPSLPPLQTPPSVPKAEKSQKKKRVRSPKRADDGEHTKHIIAEEHPTKKQIGVESKKNKNKKQFQLLGQEVKAKHKQTSSPVAEIPKTTAAPPPPKLRSISEVIQQEAATILATKRTSTRTPEEIKEETNEANESVQERTKLKATTKPQAPIDSTTSGEEDNDSAESDHDDRIDSKNAKQRVPDKADL